ncbi:hypothetical protein KKF61_09175, partial [Patescibacteria group bacterium]|nr:hypothetical protein [Patescibacteria group bacterium]
MKINADVSITHKGTTFDFFLASDEKTKVKSWQVTPGQILNPIFTSDRPLQAHIPPEREDIMRQEYFHAGMGEEYFEHGMRYYKGPCDARRKGAVLLPPRIAQATVTTTGGNVNLICLINPSFETNDTTGWTDVDAIADASADPGTEDDGDYCAKETIAAGANETFYQELQTFENLQGVEIVASGNIWVTGVGDDARIQIDDGIGTTNGNYLSGTSVAWAESTATRTINAAATKIAIEFYSNDDGGGGMFTYVDDVQIKVAKTALAIVPFRDFMGFAGSLYAIAGYYLLKWDGSTWEVQCAFPEEPQSLEVWGSYLMIGLGFDHTWVYYDGTTFEVSTVANAEAKFFTNLSGTLWFNDSNYTIRSSTNPINGGSVSATTTIEDVNHVITCLVKHPTTLLVGLENELYEVTATDEIPRMSILTQDSGTYTCHNAFVWNSLLYVPSSNGSLYEYDIDNYTITDISPASFCPNQPDFAGRIMAISGDHRWLYVVIDYATKIEILCGHWEPILNQYGDSVTDWVWHHVGEQTLTNASGNIASTCIDGLNGAKMMHLGCVHATDKAYYM